MTSGPFSINGSIGGPQTSVKSGTDINGNPIAPVSTTRSVVSKQRQYFRPKSISVKPTVNHWREPTAWSNVGMYQVIRPFGDAVIYHTAPHFPLFHQQITCPNGVNAPTWGLGSVAFPEYLVDVAVTKALLKLKNQHFDAAVAFGERKETSKMFESLAERVVYDMHGFEEAHRGRLGKVTVKKLLLGKAKRLPRGLHNNWLEMVYGWVPLMSDLYGSMEALAYRDADSKSYRVTVKQSVRRADERPPVRFSAISNAGIPTYILDAGWEGVVTDTQMCHVSLTYVLRNEFLRTLAQLGVTNPLNVAWEVVPYSFVVDWMLPIGTYLQTLDADLGWAFLGGTITRYTKSSSKWSHFTSGPGVDPWGNDSYSVDIRLSGLPVWYSWSMVRKKLNESPLPRMPRIKNPFSKLHAANGLALLRGLFSRGK